jgi:DNA-binding response OmpR family regulator
MNFFSNPRTETPCKPVGGAKRILVVDEYPELCNVAALLLSRCGYRVLTAIGAQEAKKVASSNEIDLVLTDVDLHGVSSDELASWFHDVRPQTPIVFMSDRPLQQLGLHAHHLITKPFIHLDLLVKEIREVFNHGRAEATATAAA